MRRMIAASMALALLLGKDTTMADGAGTPCTAQIEAEETAKASDFRLPTSDFGCGPGRRQELTVFKDDFAGATAETGLPEGWTSWTAAEKTRPAIELVADPTAPGGKCVCIAGAGNPYAMGSIRRPLEGLEPGKFYRFTALYKPEQIENVNNTVWPFVQWNGKHFRNLRPVAVSDEWVEAELIMRMPKKLREARLELFAGWIPRGTVRWGQVTIEALPDYRRAKREVRIAVFDEKPPKDCTLAENGRFYVEALDRICTEQETDVICLPECFNKTNVKAERAACRIEMDGDYMRALCRAAERNGVNLIGSVTENDDGLPFNTGIVINRTGTIVERYRKAQMPMPEVIRSGRSRGNRLPVVELDIGKIGMLICWDYHFSDAIRVLALKGAEIIFVPIAGEGRMRGKDEDGRTVANGMKYAGSACAVNNGVVMAFSATQSGAGSYTESMIIGPNGKRLARSGLGEERPHVIRATVDLNVAYMHPVGDSFRGRYWVERRPELYEAITDTSLRLWPRGLCLP